MRFLNALSDINAQCEKFSLVDEKQLKMIVAHFYLRAEELEIN